MPHCAFDPKWNVDGRDATTGANIDAALDAAESDDTHLGRLRDVLSDEAADARFRRELGRCGGRFGTADLDDDAATAEAPPRKVSSSSRAARAFGRSDLGNHAPARCRGVSRFGTLRGQRPSSSKLRR